MYLEPHDYRIHYVNIDLHLQYGISVTQSQTLLLLKSPQRQRVRRNSCFHRLAFGRQILDEHTPIKAFFLKLQSWTKLLRKLRTWGAFFLNVIADPFFPLPLPLEAVLLGLQKKAGSLSICRKQL